MIGMSQFNDFSLLKGLYILCKWLMQLLHFHFKNQNRSLKGTGAKCDVCTGSWGSEYLGKVSDYLGGVGDYGCVPPKSKNCINKPLFCAQKERILRSRVCETHALPIIQSVAPCTTGHSRVPRRRCSAPEHIGSSSSSLSIFRRHLKTPLFVQHPVYRTGGYQASVAF